MNGKFFFMTMLAIYSITSCYGQKKPLSHLAFDDWEEISDQSISDDGKYVVYVVRNRNGKHDLLLKASDGSYEELIQGGFEPRITRDGKLVVFKISSFKPSGGKPTLCIAELGKGIIFKREDIRDLQIPADGSGKWLAYRKGDNLTLLDLTVMEEEHYSFVDGYVFNSQGDALVLATAGKKDSLIQRALLWLDLKKKTTDTIFRNFCGAGSFVFNNTGRRIAFLASKADSGTTNPSLYYYEKGMKLAKEKVAYTRFSIDKTSSPIFSNDNNRIIFWVETSTAKVSSFQKRISDHVIIWRYNDDYLPTELQYQTSRIGEHKLLASVHIISDSVSILSDAGEEISWPLNGINKHILAVSTKGNIVSKQWMLRADETAYIISLQDGARKFIANRRWEANSPFVFSPDGKFVIWYDLNKKNYFSYDVIDNITRNITHRVPSTLFDDEYDRPGPAPSFGLKWFNGYKSVFIYDRYDIWRVDPKDIIPPKNITRSYGLKNKIIFRIPNSDNNLGLWNCRKLFLLSAFDKTSKYMGFFYADVNNHPSKLVMGPYYYSRVIKARYDNGYLFERMNDKQSPNLFFTRDWKDLSQISHINPQQLQYNWMTASLSKWQLTSRKFAEGVLYKPENFDSTKKYPVILSIYEKKSDELYKYKNPELSAGAINIPYFVSNGYLVFEPDIYYKIGDPGESAVNSVSATVKYLLNFSFVDSFRIGIQGHSWGGYQVGFITAKTNLFAAAVACSGQVDFISGYGAIRDDGKSRQFQYENGQLRMGTSIWSDPERYIRNSSVFFLDRVETPLLIMHNQNDGAVPWSQAVEYFTALRRLGKKSWMLNYPGENHWISKKENRLDFSIRMKAFFDHYLKSAPMPRWMIGKEND